MEKDKKYLGLYSTFYYSLTNVEDSLVSINLK